MATQILNYTRLNISFRNNCFGGNLSLGDPPSEAISQELTKLSDGIYVTSGFIQFNLKLDEVETIWPRLISMVKLTKISIAIYKEPKTLEILDFILTSFHNHETTEQLAVHISRTLRRRSVMSRSVIDLISTLTRLRQLKLTRLKLKNPDTFVTALNRLPLLRELEHDMPVTHPFGGISILNLTIRNKDELDLVATSIRTDTVLQQLTLSMIESLCLLPLGDALSVNTTLRSLSFSTSLEYLNFDGFLDRLVNNTSLLHLKFNGMDESELPAMAHFLDRNTELESLELNIHRFTSIPNDFLKSLATTKLLTFDFYCLGMVNIINPVHLFLQAVIHNTSIRHLVLGSHIHDLEVLSSDFMTKFLATNAVVRKLYITREVKMNLFTPHQLDQISRNNSTLVDFNIIHSRHHEQLKPITGRNLRNKHQRETSLLGLLLDSV